MTPTRFRLTQLTTFSLILTQALGLGAISSGAYAQSANGAKPSLPTPVSAQSLIGLDMPPQMVVTPKQAIPTNGAPSNVSNNKIAVCTKRLLLVTRY